MNSLQIIQNNLVKFAIDTKKRCHLEWKVNDEMLQIKDFKSALGLRGDMIS